MKKVKLLDLNWHQCGSVQDRVGCGENYSRFQIGVGDVVEITENEPNNGMQLWNYEVIFSNGSSRRVFNPNYV